MGVGAAELSVPNPGVDTLGKDRQEVLLHGQRQVSDLIDKKNAPICGVEPTGSVLIDIRRRPLPYAEELALGERFD